MIYRFATTRRPLSSGAFALALTAMLSACVSRDEWIARDSLTCATIGFSPSSPEYRNCVLQLETARLHGHHHGH